MTATFYLSNKISQTLPDNVAFKLFRYHQFKTTTNFFKQSFVASVYQAYIRSEHGIGMRHAIATKRDPNSMHIKQQNNIHLMSCGIK